MNKTTNITIRVNTELKNDAEDLFNDFGLTLSSAFTMFLKQSVREQRIPFEIKRNIPNKETIEAIKEVEEMEKNPSSTKSFKSVEELMKDLKNEI